MATPADRVHELEKQRKELKAKLVATGDMRQGSLVKRYRQCGKPGCHCAQAGAEGHGPRSTRPEPRSPNTTAFAPSPER